MKKKQPGIRAFSQKFECYFTLYGTKFYIKGFFSTDVDYDNTADYPMFELSVYKDKTHLKTITLNNPPNHGITRDEISFWYYGF
jgi:hypothetical protein